VFSFSVQKEKEYSISELVVKSLNLVNRNMLTNIYEYIHENVNFIDLGAGMLYG
jgi:hypothetical protein